MEIKYLLLAAASFLANVHLSEQCPPFCGWNAHCQAGVCVCDDGFEGLPYLICFPENWNFCHMFGDPKITGFSDDSTRLKLACKANFARFDTNLDTRGGQIGDITDGMEHGDFWENCDCTPGHCRVSIRTDIEMSPAPKFLYYVGEAFIRLVVNRGWPSGFHLGRLRIRLSSYRAQYRQQWLVGGWSPWHDLSDSGCTIVTVAGARIEMCYENALWRIESRDCDDLLIIYRPWEVHQLQHAYTAGIAVGTAVRPICNMQATRYPYSICHRSQGNNTVYKDYKRYNGFTTRYGSSMYAMMLDRNPNFQSKPVCERIQRYVDNCPAGGVDAFNECQYITMYWASCANANGYDCTELFTECLVGFCTGSQARCDWAANRVVDASNPNCPSAPPSFQCSP